MRVTLGQLKAFGAVARLGSFSGAANELFVTQPAASEKIRLLQEEVGLPLASRGRIRFSECAPSHDRQRRDR
jgi:LysR family glycine cleavage system transcriptional activator